MESRIAIIEDNPTNLELMVCLLEAFGYQPLTAEDGVAGLALIRQERPDLVLCDIEMPRMDGYEVARHLKSDPQLRGITLVAVTAIAMVGDKERTLAAGFDGYIAKPINPHTFVAEIEGYLGVTSFGARRPAEDKRRVSAGATILAIDDLATNVSLLRSLLEPFGYQVASACGMSQGLAMARECAPDVIVSDVCMHEGSGFDLCRNLKQDDLLKNIPIVLITSTCSDEASRQKGLAAGAARFLFRPIASETLLAEVEACLNTGK